MVSAMLGTKGVHVCYGFSTASSGKLGRTVEAGTGEVTLAIASPLWNTKVRKGIHLEEKYSQRRRSCQENSEKMLNMRCFQVFQFQFFVAFMLLLYEFSPILNVIRSTILR